MDYRTRHLQKYWILDFPSNTYERTKASCAVLLTMISCGVVTRMAGKDSYPESLGTTYF